MRLIFGIVLLAGLGLAGFAVYMAQGYIGAYQTALERERASSANKVDTTEVFVAARPIRYGQALKPEDVSTVRWPTNALPEGAFLDAAALFPEGKEARVVLRAMEAGEAILAVKVTEPGQDAGVSSRLSAGMRAFAVRVDVASGVSGFLRPGDRVDVYWTGRAGDADVTKLIQTGIRIVAIDQSADEDETAPSVARTVTVEADPQQVARLAQAQSTGRLSLALMGATDDGVADAVQVDQGGLLGIVREEPTRVVEVEAPKACTVRTRRGGEVATVTIPCSN
jgi:pilus assembly protein CpaB